MSITYLSQNNTKANAMQKEISYRQQENQIIKEYQSNSLIICQLNTKEKEEQQTSMILY